MRSPIDSDFVVKHLSDLWRRRLPDIAHYLDLQFGYSLPQTHRFKRLIVGQMSDGDVGNDNIGTQFSSKWVFEDGILRSVPLDYAWREMYETDDQGHVYVTASFLFFVDADQILLSERYGPDLKHRLRGRLLEPSGVDWSTLWCTRFSE